MDETWERAKLGARVLKGWETLEACVVRAGEVACGQELRMPGAVYVAMAYAEKGGYIDWTEIAYLLRVRRAYLLKQGHPPTDMELRIVGRRIAEVETELRERLGPLAPEVGAKIESPGAS